MVNWGGIQNGNLVYRKTYPNGMHVVKAPNHPRADREGFFAEHVLIAEQILGKQLPLGIEVHHVNGDLNNNHRTNLVVCENHAFHMLLHSRRNRMNRYISETDRYDWQDKRLCSICGEWKQEQYFYGKESRCKPCDNQRWHNRRKKTLGSTR